MELQPEDFHHPFTPYDIQLQFMRSLYDCLEKGKVAVFESPTGTGKSLSIICGSLTWLRDQRRKVLEESVNNVTCDDEEPEWMLEYAKRESSRAITEKRKLFEARLMKARQEEEKQMAVLEALDNPRKRQKLNMSEDSDNQSEDHFALDDYESEDEQSKHLQKPANSTNGLSSNTLQLLERFEEKASTQDRDQDEGEDEIKIYYCSRTHSQLAQFANELRRVDIPSSMAKDSSNRDLTNSLEEGIKHLSLGSRKNLCINSRVVSLENPTAINERCLDLQQPGVAAEQKCRFLPTRENEARVSKFRDHALATVRDIEDLGRLGKRVGICPYYASRKAMKYSEVVTLPYPLLLQRSAREALNLSIKGHIIIIDEAHNLMDAISNIHSVTITLSQLRASITQLTVYARKFKTRLKGKNRIYIAQVIRLVTSIADHLQLISGGFQPPEGPVQTSDLMAGKGVDQINPHKLCRYLQESKLARKVDGYAEYSRKQTNSTKDAKASMPVLFHIQSFLLPLMDLAAEGRLFYSKTHDDIQLRYLLLDPRNHFREIVDDARAVILAGGTMSPMTDYTNHLFSYVPSDRLETFSYGHVIPPENLTAQVLKKGITGTDFDFTYDVRNSEKIVIDLGRTMAAICQVIPDGVVAFFPSYDYLGRVLSIWKTPLVGERAQTVYSLIERKKPILYESREMRTSTEELLQEYTNMVQSGSGALLLSVVGGKLSEGINFSDRLGRGILIIGLPFPNIRSAVWQAKTQFIEQKAYEESSGTAIRRQSIATAVGKDFYENSCMRAVNQCIGRAIRHRHDYAAILLMDGRYDKPAIRGKLPAWIQKSMVCSSPHRPTGAVVGDLSRFFATHTKSQ
ncbi:ATP-dependent RNA helicase chl1 [Aspergillus avenaceus]|uniref:ATP-dependent DNA helicase CHL1 n=1 Tax=Aspergillus avenaceus TaxID=36643 RepID=A0A5N6TDF9_ASPAV|nr:ATP-dependent RNA helicase chl1 [Aspergillus avenaceus]